MRSLAACAKLTCRLALVLTLGSGCNSESERDKTLRDLSYQGAAQESTARELPTSPLQPLVFEHDFGVLSPNEERSWSADIFNSTDCDWSVKDVRSACRCVSLWLSTKEIAPDTTARAVVRYVGGAKPEDDWRIIDLTFHDKAAPIVQFSVKAHVRTPATPDPLELILPRADEGEDVTGAFSVMNFSGSPWSDVKLASSQDWMHLTAIKSPSIDAQDGPRPLEVWSVTVRCSSSGTGVLSSLNRAVATFEARYRNGHGEEAASVEVPVYFRVEPSVAAFPASLVLAPPKSGNATSAAIRIFARDETLCPLTPEAIRVTHDLGSALTVSVIDAASDRAVLRVSAPPVPEHRKRDVTGSVTVTLSHGDGKAKVVLAVPVKIVGDLDL
ncbi:MAG TPA: hypothetical protein VFI31_02445 [Pirellulales bacterium]|nr:hypothetical protein [Pirellulales bacterium]